MNRLHPNNLNNVFNGPIDQDNNYNLNIENLTNSNILNNEDLADAILEEQNAEKYDVQEIECNNINKLDKESSYIDYITEKDVVNELKDNLTYNDYKLSDLNWKDDTLENNQGDIDGSDPSMSGYNRGWQEEPYKQRYYANKEEKKLSRLRKIAAKEIIDINYNAEKLADEILQLWSQTDGPIQNFFEAFTMNKMDNKLKIQIAQILNQKGYKVYPILEDRKVRTAKKKNIEELINYYKQILPDSVALDLVLGDIKTASKKDINKILDYYKKIYPEEYSLDLLKNYYNKELNNDSSDDLKNTVEKKINNLKKKSSNFNELDDLQYSNESLKAIEDRLNEQSDPMNKSYYQNAGPNMDFGMDWTTDMRSDFGFPANVYEASKLKKKFKNTLKTNKLYKEADEISNIPLYLIMDAISEAGKNVSLLLNRKLEIPPVFLKSQRKQEFSNNGVNKNLYDVESVNIVQTYEIWKVFLDQEKTNLNECYVVVSADYTLQGYRNGKWSNVKYNGFYTTIEEAENEINAYL